MKTENLLHRFHKLLKTTTQFYYRYKDLVLFQSMHKLINI